MANYVQTIRKKVGHDPIVCLGCCIIIQNEKGEFLLEKRSDNGLFCFPGGGIELGEKVKEGAKREVFEETGLTVERLIPIEFKTGEEGRLVYPNGDVTYYADVTFQGIVSSFEGLKINDGESTKLVFVSLESFPSKENCLRGTHEALRAFLSYDGHMTVD